MDEPLPIVSEGRGEWYRSGLKFQCTGCGKCCSGGPGAVWVNKEEIQAIARRLNLSIEEFRRRYVHRLFGRDSLKDGASGRHCIFLNNNKCSIYEVRPTQCQTYPWWPGIVRSEEAWREEAKWCEGIAESAPVVEAAKIEMELERYKRDVDEKAE